jgi:hypothetical protein
VPQLVPNGREQCQLFPNEFTLNGGGSPFSESMIMLSNESVEFSSIPFRVTLIEKPTILGSFREEVLGRLWDSSWRFSSWRGRSNLNIGLVNAELPGLLALFHPFTT